VWTLVCATAALIVGEIIVSGEALSVIATQRSEHLTTLGFHSNEFGTFLAIAYGLCLGVWNSAESGRHKNRLGAIVVATGIALLLTFSRGAYLAFAVTNVVVFMGSSPKKRAAFLLVTLLLALAAPAPLVDRAGYGLTTRDANEISAGRVDNLWIPLLPDIADHLWVGQGLQSIMWTEAQLFQQIYPVNHAHNAFLDLLLDLGVLGAIPVLVWYAYVWREFVRRGKTDPDPEFRAIFIGGHLALLSFFLCALTNNRLTPTAPTCLLWVVMGVLLGRIRQKPESLDQIAPETTSQRKWRPLVAAATMTRTTA
jgi:O-antigen ligase